MPMELLEKILGMNYFNSLTSLTFSNNPTNSDDDYLMADSPKQKKKKKLFLS